MLRKEAAALSDQKLEPVSAFAATHRQGAVLANQCCGEVSFKDPVCNISEALVTEMQ